jgi:predicted enzyme related to lactoylglutathione lyase
VTRQPHAVAGMQLAPAAVLGRVVYEHRLGRQQRPGFAAAADDAGQLQQLPEADRLAADCDLLAHQAESSGADARLEIAIARLTAMGERNGYSPGTFCWVELATTDQAAAKEFYAALFGWVADDRPVGEGSYYSMQQLDGRQVAAIAGQPQQQREAGVPALWHSYVWVDDADAAAGRARELGGSVHAGPFDVMQAGRMAVLQDPQGAYFMLWEPREHRGAELVNAPGAFAWNELSTSDVDAAQSFYGGLFGWSFEPYEGSPQLYLGIRNGEANNGGVRELAEPMPPN